jgi:hypothetical protein
MFFFGNSIYCRNTHTYQRCQMYKTAGLRIWSEEWFTKLENEIDNQ